MPRRPSAASTAVPGPLSWPTIRPAEANPKPPSHGVGRGPSACGDASSARIDCDDDDGASGEGVASAGAAGGAAVSTTGGAVSAAPGAASSCAKAILGARPVPAIRAAVKVTVKLRAYIDEGMVS